MKNKSRKPAHKCKSAYCRNDKPDGYDFCHKCRSRKYASKQPISYFWNSLKQNAKAKGRFVNISRAEYETLWVKVTPKK